MRATTIVDPTTPGAGGAGPVLSAVGVGVHLGGREILGGIDLDINAGEFLAILGPNGAGKSTLLSVLSGDLQPDYGRVVLGGKPLPQWNPGELARRRSVLLQEQRVSFGFRTVDVVRWGRTPWRGTSDADSDDAVVHDAMAVGEILGLADRIFPSLSGGEKARTGFARLLAQQGVVLMLDEPTAALDIHHQERVLAHLRSLADAGAAVVLVIHDLTLAAAFADRVAVVGQGAVRADGPPIQVLTAELLSEVYQHPIDVLAHPATGVPMIMARRSPRRPAPNTRAVKETRSIDERAAG